jgi:LysM repeat protein
MTENERNSMNWVVAVFASVLMHAGVVALFMMSGRPPAVAADDGPEAPSLVESGDAEGEASAPRDEPRPSSASVEPAASAAPPSAAPVRAASAATSADTSSEARPSVPVGERVAEIPEFYTVRQGDTLTKIARSFGTTPEELAKVNGKELRQMDRIWVGQKIRLRAR